MTTVAFYPTPFHCVTLVELVQSLPEISIFYRLFAGGAPAISLPASEPFGDPFTHVLRIGGDHNLAGFFQCCEPLNCGQKLHSIIGGELLPSVKGPFDLRSEEHTSELQSRENLVCRLLLEKN